MHCGSVYIFPTAIGSPWNHLFLDKVAAILASDNFKHIFLNENVGISTKISLKFVPKSPIDSKSALVQVMAWRRTGDKLLPGPTAMPIQFADAYMRHLITGKLPTASAVHWFCEAVQLRPLTIYTVISRIFAIIQYQCIACYIEI